MVRLGKVFIEQYNKTQFLFILESFPVSIGGKKINSIVGRFQPDQVYLTLIVFHGGDHNPPKHNMSVAFRLDQKFPIFEKYLATFVKTRTAYNKNLYAFEAIDMQKALIQFNQPDFMMDKLEKWLSQPYVAIIQMIGNRKYRLLKIKPEAEQFTDLRKNYVEVRGLINSLPDFDSELLPIPKVSIFDSPILSSIIPSSPIWKRPRY